MEYPSFTRRLTPATVAVVGSCVNLAVPTAGDGGEPLLWPSNTPSGLSAIVRTIEPLGEPELRLVLQLVRDGS